MFDVLSFVQDTSGENFVSIVTNRDFGINDAWCACIHWDDEGIYFFTQYEPAIMCDDDPCLHLPLRCHFDNYLIEWLA